MSAAAVARARPTNPPRPAGPPLVLSRVSVCRAGAATVPARRWWTPPPPSAHRSRRRTPIRGGTTSHLTRPSSSGAAAIASRSGMWSQHSPAIRHGRRDRRAASARTRSSRRSSRNHRRPRCSVYGTCPRVALPFSAASEQPSTAAAAGASAQSCSSSGGRNPTGRASERRRSRAAAARSRAAASSSTWARDNAGRSRRDVRSPRWSIFGIRLTCTPSTSAASRCVTHSPMDRHPGRVPAAPPTPGVAGLAESLAHLRQACAFRRVALVDTVTSM
jgi:hypothetical protein